MGDEKTVVGALQRSPAADARCCSRPQQIDRRAGAKIMAESVRGEMPFVRPPPEFGGLRAFADKPVDRPGVDEFAWLLGNWRDLRVSFSDVNNFDTEPFVEARPVDATGWRHAADTRVSGKIDQRLLDEMRDEARVGAMC